MRFKRGERLNLSAYITTQPKLKEARGATTLFLRIWHELSLEVRSLTIPPPGFPSPPSSFFDSIGWSFIFEDAPLLDALCFGMKGAKSYLSTSSFSRSLIF